MRQAEKIPTFSVEDLRAASEDAVRSAILLEPSLPAAQLAESIIRDADPDMLSQLAHSLEVKHFAGLVNAERKRARETDRREHLLFPEWDRLPAKVTLPNGKKIDFGKSKYIHARSLVARLKKKHRAQLAALRLRVKEAKLEKPPELVQAEEWAATMQKYTRKHRGITSSEVAALEAEKASKKK